VKVGDLVRWGYTKPPGLPGIVLKVKPSCAVGTSLKPALAVFAYIPECPDPEWFHEHELELLSEVR